MVYALRANRDDESLFKQLGTRAFYRLMNAKSRFQVPPDAGDFRLMDRAVVNALQALPERNRFMKGLYAWVGFKSVAIPYEPAERASGSINYSAALAGLSIDGLTASPPGPRALPASSVWCPRCWPLPAGPSSRKTTSSTAMPSQAGPPSSSACCFCRHPVDLVGHLG